MAIWATSRAVVYCPWVGSPVQLRNFVRFMPNSPARRFIWSTNSSSDPYKHSARATAESLALPTITLFSNWA